MIDIPNFEGYKVDENSNIYSLFMKKIMKTKISMGYKCVGLRKNGKTISIGCHRLAVMAFHGTPEGYEKLHACHSDGDKTNNHISNLRWGTPTENARDKYLHGTAYNNKFGEEHYASKLTEKKVIELRVLAETNNCMELSIKFGIPKLTIYDAVTGKTWKCVNNIRSPVSLKGRQYHKIKRSEVA